MSELIVHEGHFWIRIEDMLCQERKEELKKDLENTDRLLRVKGELWTRIENPHPTKRQKILHKAKWRPEDLEVSRSLKKAPKIKD